MQNARMIRQEAINNLLMDDLNNDLTNYTPDNLRPKVTPSIAFEHLEMPMVHPVTGETISSYKKLKNNPVTVETWMTAFGKKIGGMAQGNNKTGQKGTKAIFVMSHIEIALIPSDRIFTYAGIIVDHRLQKKDPNRIRLVAGGNLSKDVTPVN